ncbi:PTS glucose transporter subunit IIA [Paenibacillus sp. H1-7]|uniref:PTS sugar transporter subunit IIA n=1 Tax=Paenibacillus sp. H1-7 TaxID=2282849 RepID=UPI001EF7B324|nr:PTS glucose transporter subunit IIA [Paenibacillus sp. H1-7]ULL17247.1 PTS glucose transporter subunit IIA [Paenibacillus sp. H1-7]
MHSRHDRSNTSNRQLLSVQSPLSGRSLPLEEVPDKAFARKHMGEGMAIEPSEGKLVAPFDGVVVYLIGSKHALIIQHETGLQLLIHVGINTVALKGEGFAAHIGAGDKVRLGQTLITFDIAHIRDSGYSAVTPVVVVNDDFGGRVDGSYREVKAGESQLMTIAL